MSTPETESAAEPKIVFRAGKKRKAYRQRAEEEVDNAPSTAAHDATPVAPPTAEATPQEDEEEGLSVAEALRLRNARKHKLGGVGFRAGQFSNNESATADHNTEQGLVVHDGACTQTSMDIIGAVNTRFAPQTGLVGEIVNKHMEEYVESELARRKRNAAEASAREEEQANKISYATYNRQDSTTTGSMPQVVDSERVLQGKLMEIDLGEDARARNIEMTERARRRLQGQIDEEDEQSGDGRRKVRIGRDGKPWRPRNRRNSDDIKRDQLVEAFLSENKLDMYDVSAERSEAAAAPEENDEYAADDRIAEEFRRDFMDAIAQRNRKRRPATTAKQAAKSREDVLKGPKLGGSRNARAAARDVLLKEQQSKRR
ncbi:hepatocellular carcinoma-associated antigen 59-domain-containing protein [Podospora fimiseda]|uniref:Hepatocellular carcinoma-associated antigen 59-domain-containing protein n=1 Tax=Podospora fimiseda TaxID=252190 RepID=A0AAN7GZ73_9PEZI|nr:hepatocellular carcinoma-associated antigen 59-domain-containing protein [Podospora fimiseda]